jgi:hypothetical protein
VELAVPVQHWALTERAVTVELVVQEEQDLMGLIMVHQQDLMVQEEAMDPLVLQPAAREVQALQQAVEAVQEAMVHPVDVQMEMTEILALPEMMVQQVESVEHPVLMLPRQTDIINLPPEPMVAAVAAEKVVAAARVVVVQLVI